MRICIFKGQSNNSVLRILADELAEDSREAGIEAEVLDLQRLNDDNIPDFKNKISGFDIIISFNGIGSGIIDSTGQHILNTVQATVVMWFVDDPAYYYDRITLPLKNKVILYPNTSHAKYIDLISPETPHKPLLCGHPKFKNIEFTNKQKRMPIIAALSWHGIPHEFWKDMPAGNTRNIIERSVLEIKTQSELTVYEVFARNFKEISGVAIEELNVNRTISIALCSITDYFRKLDRINLVKAISATKLPITLVGNGWEGVCANMPNINLVDEIKYDDLFPLYQSHEIVINMNAANGGCERAFSALASGARVLSDYSSHLEAVTAKSPSISFYDRTSEDDIIKKILCLYYDFHETESAGLFDGDDEAHLWRNRIIDICNFAIK